MSLEPTEHNVLLLHLEDPLEAESLAAYQQEIENWLAMGSSRVVVSLRDLGFISSPGLSFLIRMRKRLKSEGGRLVLSEVTGFVAKAIRVLDLEELFHIFDSDEKAVRTLRDQA